MAEGKLTVGVEIDASKAFDGFADSVLKQLKPQLDRVQRDMQNAVGGGGGGGGGGGRWSQLGDIAAGSFIGALGSQLAVKGLAVIQDFASKAADAVRGILSGGWDRLVALDTAKTKMLALGVSASDTEVVMKNALEAVKGTAFGLGDAATVAATALAAGVKPGKALTDYLKLTADTAAVARKAGADLGVTFNEVGSALNKITTQGYATNQELQMLSDKGLPIYQNLAKNLGLATGEVIKLASETGIGASVVRTALEDTVGGAALKMGESFEGAMANAEAAFDRLGEALLKPFFQPVKDGVNGVTDSIDQLTEIVTRNAPEIIRTVGGIATAFIEMSEFALKSLGDLLAGFGEIIAPLGDIQGAMLKFQAFQAEFRGDDELAEQLRADAEEAFGLGEGLQDLGNRLKAVDSDPLKNRINALTNELARGAEVNNAYTASQKALADAFAKGPQWGALLYQQQMIEWQNKVREANARGENGWSIPAPVRPGVGGGAATGGMPADVTRQSGAGSGSGSKADAPLLFPPGTPIPSLGDLPKAGDDLTQSATALDDAADALTAAASSGIGGAGLGGMGGFGLNPQNVSLQGLQPQSLALLSLIQGMPQFAGIPLTSGFRASDPYPWHPGGRGLDLGLNASDPIQSALGDQLKGFLETNKALFGINHVLWKVKDHFDHLHIGLNEGPSPLLAGLGGLMPGSAQLPSFDVGAAPIGGWSPADPKALREANQRIIDLETQLQIKEQRLREMRADVSESQKMSAVADYEKSKRELEDAKADLEELKKGKYERASVSSASSRSFDFNQLPFGHPARIMAGAIGGAGGTPEDIAALVSPMLGSFGGPLGGAAGQIAGSIFGVPLPGPMGYPGVPTAPSTDLNTLVQERNPLALFQAAGIDVPDYSRFGGGPGAQDVMQSGGPASDAMGRIYSDTAALIDRTFTNMDAAAKARHDQTMTVLNEVRDRLAGDFVGPVTEQAVTDGIDGIGTGTAQMIGQAIGQAAAPPIASAVASATAGSGGGGGEGAALVNTSVGALTNAVGATAGMAGGGGVFGGVPGKDSVPAMLMPGEWVFTTSEVARMGGMAGMERFRNALMAGKVRGYATGGGVDVSSSVGAEFFGVGQVPILAAIVNLLVAILLKVVGVNIEARDTLNEISSDFREFRGEFQAFDAGGRLMNDTSGLIDRTGSSEQAAADERIRILKLVLEGLFKFIVEKIVVPIAKAVGNSLLQVASGALQGAAGAASPGGSIVGGMVGNVITSAGGAGIEIAGEVGTIVAESIFSVAQDAIGELLQSLLPGITNGIFGGGLLAMIVDPITSVLNGLFSGIGTVFGGLLGGLSTLIPGLPFDNGGVAVGVGMMPKATLQPERVLSPQQTQSFDRLVAHLTNGGRTATTTVHAPFYVSGGREGAEQVRDRLLSLMS